jgi:hypothetical protein
MSIGDINKQIARTMNTDDLLRALSELAAEVVELRAALQIEQKRVLAHEHTYAEITRELDKADAPKIHIVNRIEWLAEKACGES